MTDIGKKAPAFTLPDAGGGKVSLKDFEGQPVVVYFYPKDDTPGCTTEAKDFTTLAAQFKKAGAVVIGISKDSVARHKKFADKYGLKVTLLSDEDGEVCEKYGVWIEKSMYGRSYMGIERATFLIGGNGLVRQVWRKVKVKGHAQEVLDAVQAL